jgi:hypothetical protein
LPVSTIRLPSIVAVCAGLLAAALAAPAVASTGEDAPRWATVNVCAPGQLGLRASLPGGGRGRMSARFSAEWLDPSTKAWRPISGSSSPWIDAGSAKVGWTQVGWTFSIDSPPPGERYQLRGVAQLRWSSGRTATLISSAGAGTTAGASLATCTLGSTPTNGG